MNDEKRKISTTTDGRPPRPGFEDAPAPAPTRADGQHEAYWVLSDEERAKGFVRPVRTSYRHVGIRPRHPLRDLTDEERTRYAEHGYAKFEEYPESERPLVGRFWTAAALASGCGSVTTMGRAIAETYARQPKYYNSTFCVACGKHLPVDEFVWDDGSGEVVGS